MARIDIVVFPNGGREIFGQVRPEQGVPQADVLAKVNEYVAGLEPAAFSRKFTGYYEDEGPLDIEWQEYDPSNPIVQIPVEKDGEAGESEDYMRMPEMAAVELAQIPAEQRDALGLNAHTL